MNKEKKHLKRIKRRKKKLRLKRELESLIFGKKKKKTKLKHIGRLLTCCKWCDYALRLNDQLPKRKRHRQKTDKLNKYLLY